MKIIIPSQFDNHFHFVKKGFFVQEYQQQVCHCSNDKKSSSICFRSTENVPGNSHP